MLDSDEVLARELHVSAAVDAPFSPLSEPIRAQNRELMANADSIVVAPAAIGPANLANLEDLLGLVEGRRIFLLRGPPVAERDFTGGAGSRLLLEVQARGAVTVDDVPTLLWSLHERTAAR